MISTGGKSKMRSVDTAKVKLKSRVKTYKGKTFIDFVGTIDVNGKILLISITKEKGKDLIYPVKGSDGQPVMEKYTNSPLHVIYARVTELTKGSY